MSSSYVEQVLEGNVLWTEIDDFIDRWHQEQAARSIEEFLGMTPGEYGLYVEQPRALRFILAAHESDESVEELLDHADDQAVAARGLDPDDAEKVRDWLRKTGRLHSA